jgi:hypothetical protein
MSSIVNFGKHEGETLVEIVFSDPAWFQWAVVNQVFFDRGGRPLQAEAEEIWHKAQYIRIPREDPSKWQAAYYYQGWSHKFMDLMIVEKGDHEEHANLLDVLDLAHVCQFGRDVKGNKLLVTAIKRILFGKGAKPTREKLEKFFAAPDNFDLPSPMQQAAE